MKSWMFLSRTPRPSFQCEASSRVPGAAFSFWVFGTWDHSTSDTYLPSWSQPPPVSSSSICLLPYLQGGGCCQPVYRFLSWLTPSLTSQTSCGGECSPGVLTAAQSPAPGHLLLFPLPVPSPGWAPLFTISLWGFRALQQKGVKPSASVFYPQQSTKCLAVLFFITCLPHPQTHFANSPIRPPTSPCCFIRWSRFPLY